MDLNYRKELGSELNWRLKSIAGIGQRLLRVESEFNRINIFWLGIGIELNIVGPESN